MTPPVLDLIRAMDISSDLFLSYTGDMRCGSPRIELRTFKSKVGTVQYFQ